MGLWLQVCEIWNRITITGNDKNSVADGLQKVKDQCVFWMNKNRPHLQMHILLTWKCICVFVCVCVCVVPSFESPYDWTVLTRAVPVACACA